MALHCDATRTSSRALLAAVKRTGTIAARREPCLPYNAIPYCLRHQIHSHKHNAFNHRRWQSNTPQQSQPKTSESSQPGPNTQLIDALRQSDQPDLVTAVNIPPDPQGILDPDHPAMTILGNSSLVIQRQLEMMNVMVGFEQANRYIVLDGKGNTVGYIAEQDHGFGQAVVRQAARTHRSFTAHVFDADQKEVLRIHRPFAYINSRIRIYDPDTDRTYEEKAVATSSSAQSSVRVSPLKLDELHIIGECHQVWSAVKRKYNLFTLRPDQGASIPEVSNEDLSNATESNVKDNVIEASMHQFAEINEPMLSWDFNMRQKDGMEIGSVNRTFRGFAREIFTDTGAYILRMDAAAQASQEESKSTELVHREAPGLTLDQRAVMMATAVSIDFDYFSRHSGHGGMGFMPLWWPGAGGAAEAGAAGTAGGAVGGAAVEAGALEGVGAGAAGAAGAAGRGIAGAGAAGAGTLEGGLAGAGTMAGYEAMQRGFGRDAATDDASPQSTEGPDPRYLDPADSGQEDLWGAGQDPWAEQQPGQDLWSDKASDLGSGAGDGEGGGGVVQAIWDFFSGGD